MNHELYDIMVWATADGQFVCYTVNGAFLLGEDLTLTVILSLVKSNRQHEQFC